MKERNVGEIIENLKNYVKKGRIVAVLVKCCWLTKSPKKKKEVHMNRKNQDNDNITTKEKNKKGTRQQSKQKQKENGKPCRGAGGINHH